MDYHQVHSLFLISVGKRSDVKERFNVF
ncbi:hypothetical protein RDI58_004507 [Solanum bulbocastanum]|uniref:Uncharacterized protein n=1 Tax=Solanum bulbocastanum TaxID=147425 RepID=A0AAN8U5Z1_SOLBU